MSDSHTDDRTDSFDANTAMTLALKSGAWLGWTGLVLALLWWASAGTGFYLAIKSGNLPPLSPTLVTACCGLIFLPGLILLFAGFVARQNKRTHEANLLLLRASGVLLAPARQAVDDITNLAEATRYSTTEINETATNARNALTEISDALASERLRAESVSYAMADNTRDLTERLSEERKALETLSRTLNEQAANLENAIPRQAKKITDASAATQQHIVQSDKALEARIEHLTQASAKLATRLVDLDAIARDAVSRTDALHSSIARIEDKLGQSHKTIEMAERASTMAVEAASQTGKALQNAVSFALDGAREANREIAENVSLMQSTSARAMADLRRTGIEAAQTAARVQEQSNGIAASAQSLPPRISKPLQSDELFEQEKPVLRARNRPTITEVSIKPSDRRASDARRVEASATAPNDKVGEVAEDVLFENNEGDAGTSHGDAAPTRHLPEPDPAQAMELGTDVAPILLNAVHNSEPPNDDPASHQWRDIIADIGQDPQGGEGSASEHSAMPAREATAEALISRLQDSGIPLPTAFRSRDKKKIAAAARKDHHARRRAIRNAAGQEVQRVTTRLTKDVQLMKLAQRFVSAEEDEALKALKETGSSGRHASSRLSAYLLVDAALEPILRATDI